MTSIIEKAAEKAGTLSDISDNISNVASITTNVITSIKAIDTTSSDVSTFSALEAQAHASKLVAETIEASGAQVSINLTDTIESANSSVIVDNIFEPTQAEKGIKILQDLNISQTIIDDISAITLSSNGNTVVGSHIDFSSIDSSSNVRIARDAMMDIIFGNDPSATSFISTKSDLGIILHHTGFSNTINA